MSTRVYYVYFNRYILVKSYFIYIIIFNHYLIIIKIVGSYWSRYQTIKNANIFYSILYTLYICTIYFWFTCMLILK